MHILFLEPFLTPILFIIIAVVLTGGFFTIWSLYRKEKDFEKKREGEFANYEKILSDAHTKAEHIVEKASEEASKLSREGDDFAKHINQNVDQTFKEVIEKNIASLDTSSHEFLTSYQSALQNLESKYQQELERMIEKIHHDTQEDFTKLQEMIRQKTIDSSSGFSKQLEDEYTKTQIEIHEYKKRKIEDISSRMDKLIMKVCEEVLGQVIPMTQHQQLITQALEKAQKEGMFDT